MWRARSGPVTFYAHDTLVEEMDAAVEAVLDKTPTGYSRSVFIANAIASYLKVLAKRDFVLKRNEHKHPGG